MINDGILKEAVLIRRVEETLLELFSHGKLNGTVHTCVGQELSAIAFAGQIRNDDFIFSNHRCHGHFISFTKDIYGLIGELLGKSEGVCGGVGGSQHLCKDNFYSNGIQGGIVPVAAGMALANKLKKSDRIGIVFIGDGTLGQGVLYESLNIVSKWDIPLLIVCENNRYAQSTHVETNLAGSILKRAEAFDIKHFQSNIWETDVLFHDARISIDYVRNNQKPAFHLVESYRLNPHSKGDDFRSADEIEKHRKLDPLNILKENNPDKYREFLDEADRTISEIIENLDSCEEMNIQDYYETATPNDHISWRPVESIDVRQVNLINQYFHEKMALDKNLVFMGEDVLSPYGGAFKIAQNLSDRYPAQVISTPISEAAITGIANGLALAGIPTFLEIMFGDFITLGFDQIVNQASKFFHMYNKQITCPVVIRTPMGGRRGYGPTHSQTLDKFLIGIDNVTTVALNTLIQPNEIYETIYTKEKHPVIVIENKLDYGKKIGKNRIKNYIFERSSHMYPVVRIKPAVSKPDATLVTYGGMVDTVIDAVSEIFSEYEIKSELIVLTRINPIDIDIICESVENTRRLFVIEEGSVASGIGSEVIASVRESVNVNFIARRIAALPVPIPSSKYLEDQVLPNKQKIITVVGETLK